MELVLRLSGQATRWAGGGGSSLVGGDSLFSKKNKVVHVDGVRQCPSATLSTTNPTWTGLGTNLSLRDERPPTNRLSHGTTVKSDWLVRFCGSLWSTPALERLNLTHWWRGVLQFAPLLNCLFVAAWQLLYNLLENKDIMGPVRQW
jgi:hypothetical protein